MVCIDDLNLCAMCCACQLYSLFNNWWDVDVNCKLGRWYRTCFEVLGCCRPDEVGQNILKLLHFRPHPKKTKPKTKSLFSVQTLKICRDFWGFEQLSRTSPGKWSYEVAKTPWNPIFHWKLLAAKVLMTNFVVLPHSSALLKIIISLVTTKQAC